MRMSRRAQRMERKHRRNRMVLGINLVSLMDIFTILVFFLLVNSSDGELLPTHKSVRLPESVSEQAPHRTVVVMVNPDNVLLDGRVITTVDRLLHHDGDISLPLQAALLQVRNQAHTQQPDGAPLRMEATIMGDRTIPYQLLKKVMATVSRSGYQHLSLAVLQKPQESD